MTFYLWRVIDVNAPSKSNKQKKLGKKLFLLVSWRSLTKEQDPLVRGGSGSVQKFHGSGTLKGTIDHGILNVLGHIRSPHARLCTSVKNLWQGGLKPILIGALWYTHKLINRKAFKGTVRQIGSAWEWYYWIGHKVLIYIVHHSVCPLVGIGTPPPL